MLANEEAKLSNQSLRVKIVSDYDIPVQGDGNQGENTDVDAQDLHRRAKLTHKSRQIPALKQRSVELKRDSKDGNGHVGKGQVSNVHVGDSPHPSGKGKA